MKKTALLVLAFFAAALFGCADSPAGGKLKFTLYVDGAIWREIRFEAGDSVALPSPSGENAVFLGWFCDEDLKEPFAERLFYDRSYTLYAKMTELPIIAPSAAAKRSFTLSILSPLPIKIGRLTAFLHSRIFSTVGGVPVSKPVTITASPS